MPLGKRTDFGNSRFCGVQVDFASNIEDVLDNATSCGFDFIVAPIADPSRRPSPPSIRPDGDLCPPFLPNQVMHTLSSTYCSNQIVGHISTWIQPDNNEISKSSLQAFNEELAWASHLSLQACMLPPPTATTYNTEYARAINQAILSGVATMPLWIRIPACIQPNSEFSTQQNVSTQHSKDPWEWWNAIRFACHHHPKLGVALEIGENLPSPQNIARWWGEPVKAIILDTQIFLTNRRGYPTLSKRHQELIAQAFAMNIQIIISDSSHHQNILLGAEAFQPLPSSPPPPPPSTAADIDNAIFPPLGISTDQQQQRSNALRSDIMITSSSSDTLQQHPLLKLRIYWEYLSFLFRKQPTTSENESLEIPYRDFLQAPLQPLQDNLESQTYEVFERDDTKYEVYREAVRRALIDRVPNSAVESVTTVLMVVGAGRGPLVAASIAAGRDSGRKLRIYAVEKNPNAVVHIHARAAREQWTNVTIIHADMRNWKAPEKADILVSELLGSFGDNELSPECLDGAQHFLKNGGISIPAAYTSYIHPITTHKLWNDVNNYNELKQFETPFVVKLHRFYALAPPQEVFTFVHPNRDDVIDNTRSITLTFHCQSNSNNCTSDSGVDTTTTTHTTTTTTNDNNNTDNHDDDDDDDDECVAAVCHGLAGYFDATLYKDVHLSIHPQTHTPNMFSWFPIYFPLRQPLRVPPHGVMDVSLWRCVSDKNVWYEWAVQCPGVMQSAVHNPNARSYYVGL